MTNTPQIQSEEERLREKIIMMLDMDKPKPTIDEIMELIASEAAMLATEVIGENTNPEIPERPAFADAYSEATFARIRHELRAEQRQHLAQLTKNGESNE